ncbi:MAG: hypothetical protein AAGI71_05550 [Bacteroidota bacterium]
MNASLLSLVRSHIAARPDRFDAAQWAWANNVQEVVQEGASPDAFRCCIAGHVLLLSGAYTERTLLADSLIYDAGYLGRKAATLLALTLDQHRELFYPSQWGEPFRRDYYLAQAPSQEAAVAVAYLKHFLDRHAPSLLEATDRAADRAPLPLPVHLRVEADAPRTRA